MAHPTRKNLEGLISYIRGLDINRLKQEKDNQHDLVVLTFESQEEEEVVLNEETKQVLIDDAYLSLLLFMRYDLDLNNNKCVDYDKFLKNISCLKRLWYTSKLKNQFNKEGKRVLVIKLEEVDKDFPGVLFKKSENAPDVPIVFTSMILALDYDIIINTLARKNL